MKTPQSIVLLIVLSLSPDTTEKEKQHQKHLKQITTFLKNR